MSLGLRPPNLGPLGVGAGGWPKAEGAGLCIDPNAELAGAGVLPKGLGFGAAETPKAGAEPAALPPPNGLGAAEPKGE